MFVYLFIIYIKDLLKFLFVCNIAIIIPLSYSRLQKCLEKPKAWRPQKKKSNATNLKLTTYNKLPRLYYALVKYRKA
jgi:hypothetical protein